MSDVQKFGEEFQRATKDGFDTSVRSFGEVSKGFQAIAPQLSYDRLCDPLTGGQHKVGASANDRKGKFGCSTTLPEPKP